MLLNIPPFAFWYSHLVIITKFSMPILAHKCKGSLLTYTLECEVEETILHALANRQLLESRNKERYKSFV